MYNPYSKPNIIAEMDMNGRGRLIKARLPDKPAPNVSWYWIPLGNCRACTHYQRYPAACLDPSISEHDFFQKYMVADNCPAFVAGENPPDNMMDVMRAAGIVQGKPSQRVEIIRDVPWSIDASVTANREQSTFLSMARLADAIASGRVTNDPFRGEYVDLSDDLERPEPAAMSTDASGHEHKGSGPGGGQFVKKGNDDYDIISKHVQNSKSLTKEDRGKLTQIVMKSTTKQPQLQRVSSNDQYHQDGEIIELGPTSFTSADLLSGDAAEHIAIKYSDEVLYVINKPQRGLDVDYAKINTEGFHVPGEKETILAGRYKVVSSKKEEHPGRSGHIKVYHLEELKQPTQAMSIDALDDD